MPPLRRTTATLIWLIAAAGLWCAAPAPAQPVGPRPVELEDVGVDPKLGDQIPLDLKFQDESGRVVSLGELFDGDRPVLLTLNYSDCPMLCRVQLDSLVDTLKHMEWTVGKEYDVVSVSINPLETPTRAKQTEQKYLERYGRSGTDAGWRFLVGPEKNIRKLADAVGFKYKYVPDTKEYAHTAALMVMTPKGVVSRYIYGVAYQTDTLRLSMVEAADGGVGSLTDQILLFCFHYDETKGKYGPAARRLMTTGAVVTIVALAVGLMPFWLRKPNQQAANQQAANQQAANQLSPNNPQHHQDGATAEAAPAASVASDESTP